MNTPQAGIFALGTSSHEYLEFDFLDRRYGAKLVAAISTLREPRTTIGGVNLVVGFRPELWSQVAPDHAPAGVHGFNTGLVGPDGFGMPATQHDAFCGFREVRTTSCSTSHKGDRRSEGTGVSRRGDI